MAFPTFLSRTSTQDGASITTHPVDMPATVSAGNTLIACVGTTVSGGTWTPPTGWTEIGVFEQTVNTQRRFRVFKKTADGSEGGATLNFVSSAGVAGAWHVLRFTETLEIEMLGEANATPGDTSPNPGNASPSWGSADTTWIACTTCGSNVSAYPSSYSNGAFIEAGSGTARIATATRNLAASSENPGAFTQANSTTWTAGVLALKLPSGPPVPVISSVTPNDGFRGGDPATVAGSNFGSSQGTGKVELASTATYASATKVVQTITSWGGTSIGITVVQGALSPGTRYVFVTSNDGEVSAGSAVTLLAPIVPPDPPGFVSPFGRLSMVIT